MENEFLEISAKTVEEAVEEALDRLGANRDEVEVTVVKKGRGGILGMGAEDALVRVRRLSPPPPVLQEAPPAAQREEVARIVRQLMEELLALMHLEATVTVQESSPESKALAFDIKGDDLGVLIGRRGQTLASFQYLVRLMVAQRLHSWIPLSVDVEGYKRRRMESLRGLALRLADRVAATRRSMTMEPMPSDERRVVHLALADHPSVTTQSMGEGEDRKVVIFPRRK